MTKDMKEKKGEIKEKNKKGEEERSHVKTQYKYRIERRVKRKKNEDKRIKK